MFLELMLKHPEASSSHPAPSFMENKARWSLSLMMVRGGGGDRAESKDKVGSLKERGDSAQTRWLEGNMMWRNQGILGAGR